MPTVSESIEPIREEKIQRMRDLFLRGLIGEPTLRRSLMILRVSDRDVDTEVNLLRMKR